MCEITRSFKGKEGHSISSLNILIRLVDKATADSKCLILTMLSEIKQQISDVGLFLAKVPIRPQTQD